MAALDALGTARPDAQAVAELASSRTARTRVRRLEGDGSLTIEYPAAAVAVESYEIGPSDADLGNVLFRAGYLAALAARLEGEDAMWVRRAARSLMAYAGSLAGTP